MTKRDPKTGCPSCAATPAADTRQMTGDAGRVAQADDVRRVAQADDARRVAQPGKKALLNRMRRIEGQVGGVVGMIEQDRYCVDIITQISAIKSALDGVAVQILSTHANGCVRRAVHETGGAAEIEELLGVVRKLMR